MASVRSIAEKTGLSASAVATALSGRKGVSEQTRQAVHQTASQMGYRRRSRGRPSRLAKLTLGLLYGPRAMASTGMTPLASAWIEGFESRVATLGVMAKTIGVSGRASQDAMLQHLLATASCNGLIVLGLQDTEDYTDLAIDLAIPLIAINRRPAYGEHGYVVADNFGGGYAVGELMALENRRKAAFLNYSGEAFDFDRCRQAGYARALKRHRIPVLSQQWTRENPETDDQWFAELWKAEVTGIFTSDDYLARRIADAAERRGLVPGKDLRIIGFDNLDLRSATGRPISSVAFDNKEIGRLAASLAIEIATSADHGSIINRSATVGTELRLLGT